MKSKQILRSLIAQFVVLVCIVGLALFAFVGCSTNNESKTDNPNFTPEIVAPETPNESEDNSSDTEQEETPTPDDSNEEQPPVTDNTVEQPDDNGEVNETPPEEETPTTPPVEEEPTPETPPVEDTEPEPPIIEDKEPVKVYFISPLEYISKGIDYTENGLVLNQTTNSWTLHYAVDLIAESGTQVKAMFDGVVLEIEENGSLGCMVKIDHQENVVITYGSLSNTTLTVGQTIKQGDIIGEVGTTIYNEHTYGDHLHLEITVDGVPVNPNPYIDGNVYREIKEN